MVSNCLRLFFLDRSCQGVMSGADKSCERAILGFELKPKIIT